jgi:hypothetical protein
MSGTFTISSPLSARSFLNTLGVDTHIPYTDGTYSNLPTVISDLKYLGIHQVRDGITNGQNGSAPLSSYITLAQAGIQFTFVMVASSTADISAELNLINQLEVAVPGSVTAIEGPNEVNNQPVTFGGVSGFQGALDEQMAIYSAVKADPVLTGLPVYYLTGYDASGLPVGPDPLTASGLANYDNQHPYPNNGQAPAAYVARSVALPNATSPTERAVFTETGYTTDQVSPDVQAKYELDLWMDSAAEGISKTYLYDLLDAYAPGSYQGDDGYGLFDDTNAPKEAANAIHALTALLQDNGTNAASFSPSPLTYSIAGLPSTGNSLAIEMSDGSTIISVWNEPQIWNNGTQTEISAPSSAVTVSLGATYASVLVYDPLDGTTPIATYSDVSSVTITVTDHPILVEFSGIAPITTPVTTPVTSPTSGGTLVLNVAETPVSGENAQFTVSVDGTQIGGVLTATALRSSGASQDITLAGNFTSGTHQVAITYLNGFTGNPADQGRMLYVNAITLDNATVFPDGQFGYDGTSQYTVTVPSPAAASNAGTADTLVLNMSEIAANGQNAQFLVSVDGQIIDDVQTITASEAAGQSQNVTLTGDFGNGSHTVTVNFLNGFAGASADQGRELFVNAITLDGRTTTENAANAYVGSQTFQVTAGTQAPVTTPPVTGLPTVSITSQILVKDTGASATDDITSKGAITLTGTVTGASGSTVAIYNGATALGAAVISNGTWSFTTTLPQGVYALDAVVTDPSGNTAKTSVEPTVTVATASPSVTITTPTETLAATNASAAVTVTGTVASGLSGTSVQLLDGTTLLGTATVNGGTWSYAASLAIGSHSITAIATDLAGNTATSGADVIAVTTPVTTPVTSPTSGGTLVLNVAETPVSGENAQFTVSVDGTQIGGVLTATALRSSGASQDITLAGNFTSGTHQVAITYLNGFTGNPADQGRMLYVNAITLDNATVFPDGQFGYDGTSQYTVTVPSPAAASNAGTADTLVLNMSEIAANGQNAQFLVSVDGQIIDDVQTITASEAAGQSQNVTLTGDFGNGSHTVTVNFLNGFAGASADQGRELFVNAITLDGRTTTENAANAYVGSQTFQVTAGTQAQPTPSVVAESVAAPTNLQTVTFTANQGDLDVNTTDAANTELNLGAGLSPADISLTAGANGALDITDGLTGDLITIDRMLDGTGSGVSQMQFIDGTTWSANQMNFTATDVTPGSTTIYGTASDDVLDGRGVATTIYGEGGNDTYIFRSGYGSLQIFNMTLPASGPSGQMDFGTGLTENNLWFSRNGSDLDINVLNSQDTVVVRGWFGSDVTDGLADFVGGDDLKLDSGLNQLISAMATYQLDNSSFNPSSALAMPTTSAIQSAIQLAWHS